MKGYDKTIIISLIPPQNKQAKHLKRRRCEEGKKDIVSVVADRNFELHHITVILSSFSYGNLFREDYSTVCVRTCESDKVKEKAGRE